MHNYCPGKSPARSSFCLHIQPERSQAIGLGDSGVAAYRPMGECYGLERVQGCRRLQFKSQILSLLEYTIAMAMATSVRNH